MMKRNFVIGLLGIFISISTFSSVARAQGFALVYSGEGACEDLCVDAARDVATAAGLQVRLVTGQELTNKSTAADVAKIFGGARVWVQPGGYGNVALWSMTQRMRDELEIFVRNGGGFVGFCAGAFFATEYIGRRGSPGLGLFPGSSIAYPYYPVRPDLAYSLEPIVWNGTKRMIYLEGGPYLSFPSDSHVEVIATYASGAVATARTTYGSGRVYITGLHPEAPAIWTEEDGVKDPDGSDQFLAVEMIQWAGRL